MRAVYYCKNTCIQTQRRNDMENGMPVAKDDAEAATDKAGHQNDNSAFENQGDSKAVQEDTTSSNVNEGELHKNGPYENFRSKFVWMFRKNFGWPPSWAHTSYIGQKLIFEENNPYYTGNSQCFDSGWKYLSDRS